MTCVRHSYQVTGYEVRVVSRGSGAVAPKWKVLQIAACRTCENVGQHEMGTVRAHDEREAARLCHVPEKDIEEIPVRARKTKAIEAPLTSWPFPVSEHKEKRHGH